MKNWRRVHMPTFSDWREIKQPPLFLMFVGRIFHQMRNRHENTGKEIFHVLFAIRKKGIIKRLDHFDNFCKTVNVIFAILCFLRASWKTKDRGRFVLRLPGKHIFAMISA